MVVSLVENRIIPGQGLQHKGLEKPCRMGEMPFGRAGVRHGLHDLILGLKRMREIQRLAPHMLVEFGK